MLRSNYPYSKEGASSAILSQENHGDSSGTYLLQQDEAPIFTGSSPPPSLLSCSLTTTPREREKEGTSVDDANSSSRGKDEGADEKMSTDEDENSSTANGEMKEKSDWKQFMATDNMTHSLTLKLNPRDFVRVSNSKTYLSIDGNRSKYIFRVSDRYMSNFVELDAVQIQFDEHVDLVWCCLPKDFSASIRRNTSGQNTMFYLPREVILQSNKPIHKVELINRIRDTRDYDRIQPHPKSPSINTTCAQDTAKGARKRKQTDSPSSSSQQPGPQRARNNALSSSSLIPTGKREVRLSSGPNSIPSNPRDGEDEDTKQASKGMSVKFGLRILPGNDEVKSYHDIYKFREAVLGAIPEDSRSEYDEQKSKTIHSEKNQRLVEVSMKLKKAEYNSINVPKVQSEVLKTWEKMKHLPKGLEKDKNRPPTVTPGCIKIAEYFCMGPEADFSEIQKWILNEKQHIMSTLTFQGEKVSELRIRYIDDEGDQRQYRVLNKIWFIYPNASNELIEKAKSLNKELPYRDEKFPNVELYEVTTESMANLQGFNIEEDGEGLALATAPPSTSNIETTVVSEDKGEEQEGRTPSLTTPPLISTKGHENTKYLVNTKADIEAKDKFGDTPLMRVSRNGHETTVKHLVTAKADIQAKNNDGLRSSGRNKIGNELLSSIVKQNSDFKNSDASPNTSDVSVFRSRRTSFRNEDSDFSMSSMPPPTEDYLETGNDSPSLGDAWSPSDTVAPGLVPKDIQEDNISEKGKLENDFKGLNTKSSRNDGPVSNGKPKLYLSLKKLNETKKQKPEMSGCIDEIINHLNGTVKRKFIEVISDQSEQGQCPHCGESLRAKENKDFSRIWTRHLLNGCHKFWATRHGNALQDIRNAVVSTALARAACATSLRHYPACLRSGTSP